MDPPLFCRNLTDRQGVRILVCQCLNKKKFSWILFFSSEVIIHGCQVSQIWKDLNIIKFRYQGYRSSQNFLQQNFNRWPSKGKLRYSIWYMHNEDGFKKLTNKNFFKMFLSSHLGRVAIGRIYSKKNLKDFSKIVKLLESQALSPIAIYITVGSFEIIYFLFVLTDIFNILLNRHYEHAVGIHIFLTQR